MIVDLKMPSWEWKTQQEALPWWLEISTHDPDCTYFFGPFDSREDALLNEPGYLEDLRSENPGSISVILTRAQPDELTRLNDGYQ